MFFRIYNIHGYRKSIMRKSGFTWRGFITVLIYNNTCVATISFSENTEILAVGRLVVKKGFSTLIEALRLLYCREMNFRSTLVGDGPLKETLRRQVEESGLSSVITLTGAQPQGYVKMAMHRATMLVAPCIISSDGDRDGLPTVLLEAMAQGLPAISTRVAGIPELVTDGHTGFCLDPEKPGVMADAIERMAGDAVLRKYLALNARKRIEDAFDIDRNTRRLREIFEDAIQAGIQERVQ
ncbi:glycosyltransferase family 4 protein [Escherichia coli]